MDPPLDWILLPNKLLRLTLPVADKRFLSLTFVSYQRQFLSNPPSFERPMPTHGNLFFPSSFQTKPFHKIDIGLAWL